MMSQFLFRLRNKVRCHTGNQIVLGNKVRIKECEINLKGSNNKLIIEDGAILRDVYIELDGQGCELHIGKGCVIGQKTYLSAREKETKLIIGERCMLSRNVRIMTSDGHNIVKNGQRINPAQSVIIGDNVWLADNATILKGVNIGNGAVIGINSTVTKSIPEHSIAAGQPARVVQTDMEWHEELTY